MEFQLFQIDDELQIEMNLYRPTDCANVSQVGRLTAV